MIIKELLRLGRFGAEGGNRTPDPRITNALLYQLSYFGIEEGLLEGSGSIDSGAGAVNAKNCHPRTDSLVERLRKFR